jgi:hypothetical protein
MDWEEEMSEESLHKIEQKMKKFPPRKEQKHQIYEEKKKSFGDSPNPRRGDYTLDITDSNIRREEAIRYK